MILFHILQGLLHPAQQKMFHMVGSAPVGVWGAQGFGLSSFGAWHSRRRTRSRQPPQPEEESTAQQQEDLRHVCMYACMHACMHVYMNKKQYTRTHKYTTYACICNMWCAPPMYPRLCSKSRLHGFRNARVIGLGSCLQIAPFFVIFKRSKTERIQPDFALHLELDLGFEAYSIECLLTPFEYAVLWFGNCILSRC